MNFLVKVVSASFIFVTCHKTDLNFQLLSPNTRRLSPKTDIKQHKTNAFYTKHRKREAFLYII